MINKLIKISYNLKKQNKLDKANKLDNLIFKFADKDEEPTPEDLAAEEEWLREEGLDLESLSNEDLLEDLIGEDREVAERYLEGMDPQTIRDLLNDLKEQQELDVEREIDQQRILDQLSSVLMKGKKEHEDTGYSMLDLPFQRQITPEASLLDDFVKLSTILDQKGKFKEADFFDKLIKKMAQPYLEDADESFILSDDDTTEEEFFLSDEESSPPDFLNEMEEDQLFYELLGLATKLEQGLFSNLNEAKDEAHNILDRLRKEFADNE